MKPRACWPFPVVGLLLLAGCTSLPAKETRIPNYSEVAFSRPLLIPTGFQVTDGSDRKQLILAGVSAFRKQRWLVAAGYFERAANSVYQSQRNEWAIACWGAAAISYLNEGNRAGFLRAAHEMEKNLSFHQRVNPGDEVALVLALKARMDGNAKAAPRVLSSPVRKVLRAR